MLRRLKNVKNAEERKKLNREKKASSKNEDETNEKLSLAFYFLNSVFLVAMAGSDNGFVARTRSSSVYQSRPQILSVHGPSLSMGDADPHQISAFWCDHINRSITGTEITQVLFPISPPFHPLARFQK